MGMLKNPNYFYNEGYLRSEMGCTGGSTRWENNAAFQNAASFAADFLDQQNMRHGKVLEVGCGRGWLVYNLREKGIDAKGAEYGTGGLQNSVCKAVFADLTETLPFFENEFDLVICLGVLSHLQTKFSFHAVQELKRVSKCWIWTNILTGKPGCPPLKQEHHINVTSQQWWENIFSNLELKPVPIEDLWNKYHYRKLNGQFSEIWKK